MRWLSQRIDRMRRRAAAAALAIVALVVLGGCGALPPRNPPRIDVVQVELTRVEGPTAYFAVTLQIANDGDDVLVIEGMQGALAIEDERIAQAALAATPIRVPAHGTARAELGAQAGMDAILWSIAAAMRRGATLLAPGGRRLVDTVPWAWPRPIREPMKND